MRKRQATVPAESTLPIHQSAPSWNTTPTITGDRNALLIGLGLGAIDDLANPPPSASSTAPNLPPETLAHSSQSRSLWRSRSPQLGSAASFSQEAAPSHGPKQLLLVSSGGPPAVRRFPAHRPTEHMHEAFISPILPPPSEASSSRSNTPQMRSAIPVMPSGPAFVSNRPLSPDPLSIAYPDRPAGLSAEEFLAQIASTPEYQASKYLEAVTFPPLPSFSSEVQSEQALGVIHSQDQHAIDARSDHTPTMPATPGSSVLTAKAPGFSWTRRSRAASISRRKGPPTPLVLTSSPATSNSDTLPGSADGRRRRSLNATINQRSPLSAPHSPNSHPTLSTITSDYDEPLHTASNQSDTQQDTHQRQDANRPTTASCHGSSTDAPTSAGTSGLHNRASSSAASAHSARRVILDRNITDSLHSRDSALRSRINSLKSDARRRQSSGSGSSAAFEFDDLETESATDGLSLQTIMGFLQRQDSHKTSDSNSLLFEHPSSDMLAQVQASHATAASDITQPRSSFNSDSISPRTAELTLQPSPPAETPPPASAVPQIPTFNVSIFGPNQTIEAETCSSALSLDRDNTAQQDAAAPMASSTLPLNDRPRKQTLVPAPPSFAIRDTCRTEPQPQHPAMLLTSNSDSVDVDPVGMVRAKSNDLGNSRWSSGSESDGESAMSIKAGRKSFSKGRKSFSVSRKSSLATTHEHVNVGTNTKDTLGENGRMLPKRSSKSHLSGLVASAAQTLPAPPKPSTTSMSKRLRLNGLASLRKKSFSNLSGQSASPSTPSSWREPNSAGPAFLGQSEFPFPPSTQPQTTSFTPTPTLPGTTLRSLDRPGYGDGEPSIKTAFAATFASSIQPPLPSPRTPASAPEFVSSNSPSGPLTTQQILAQARSNVWPENYIGTSVSSAGLSSPYLAADHDTFSHSFAPSRLAPTPPYSASAGRVGWSSAPITPPMPQSPRFPLAASQDKTLLSTPTAEASTSARTRSHIAEIAPPKNLRHIRQSSSGASLNKMRREAPAVVVTSSQAKQPASVIETNDAAPCLHPDTTVVDEARLPTISESASRASTLAEEAKGSIDVNSPPLPLPILVDRRQAKLNKAKRIRKQNDRFPRHNSWSDFGLQWIAQQGADAFDTLVAEGLPSTAILAASGAPASQSRRTLAAGGGGGGGGGGDQGDSDGSDTDDYGSSDGGGGGGGGFGGSGGAGGGRHPGSGRDDADDSEDEKDKDKETDEDQYADVVTDEDSEDDYGRVGPAKAARSSQGGAMPAISTRKTSIPASAAQVDHAVDSDSSDDRPLGQLVDDPRALQKALRAKERKRHFDLAAQALEGKGVLRRSSHARQAVPPQSRSQANDAALNPNELAHKLNKVQVRRERAQDAVMLQRSKTAMRPDVGHPAAAAVSRSKSVRTAQAERYVHPGMRARTPSEAALRAKAMVQAMSHNPSQNSPMLPGVTKMPELPSNAMVTVVAAQKAMAHAQANPTPAALAQAQALATSATAALNAAAAHVKRGGASPISPHFNHGEPIGQIPTSPRIFDGVEMTGARHRADSRGHALPVNSSGGVTGATPALASAHPPGMLQRLRSRSISRNPAPLSINTSAAPPLPELARPSTASKDSPASSSPHSIHTATFAALSQAAVHHGRPSVESSNAHGDGATQRGASAVSNVVPSSHESSSGLGGTFATPRQPHKVFILSRQRFTVVEVPVSARARDLALEVIERERLPMDDSKGGWVVFDCSAQLGIERPLREYEMITDVMNVRAHPNTDYFLIKRTELSSYLSIRSVPSSSPALAGWVYVQDRKKKWNKRWLELRDHGLYHAKNEKGKDETSICQISTFDVYLVDSSAIKMPKANGFALRSQDPITMFEKPEQDYMHYFCLTDPAAHRDWVRAIMNARTYILRQEKAVLFQIESPQSSQDAAMASGGLSRKNTSRRANGRTTAAAAAAATDTSTTTATGPSQPAPLIDSNAFAGPFAKGSLLADKAINDAKEALRGHAAVAPPTGALHDLSLMDRNAVRINEARRREDAIERQRRMKAEGQPLVDLARK